MGYLPITQCALVVSSLSVCLSMCIAMYVSIYLCFYICIYLFLILSFSLPRLFFSHPISRLCFLIFLSPALLIVEVTGHKPGFGKSGWDGAHFRVPFRNRCNFSVCIWHSVASGPLSFSMCEFQLSDSSWHGSSLLLSLCRTVRRRREKGLIPCGFPKQSSFFPIVKDEIFPMRNTALMT